MQRRRSIVLLIAALIVVGSLSLAACGEDDKTTSGQTAQGNSTDRAFAAEMIPHHESAIEMATLAKENGSRAQIKMLAVDIIAAQADEITQLKAIDQRLSAAGVEVGDLGMSEASMGMHGEVDDLKSKKGFDRTFIDMMVPHHQGAIRMARLELAKGEDVELKAVAEAIIAAQSKEIAQMNEWRMDWYGAASPSGGVPPVGEDASSADSTGGMDHSG